MITCVINCLLEKRATVGLFRPLVSVFVSFCLLTLVIVHY